MWSGCIDDWCGLNALLKVGIEKKKKCFLDGRVSVSV